MTWQLGAFAVLALGLAGGFAWYERARPDSRQVALVATLAALAAIGRIAFAAVPNVKPTTDIVLIAGLALGAAPGYVVGAIAALSSNFFFGQGPWTPWQMAGWGLVGLAGALLAAITHGTIGRRALAFACFWAGLVFTALQDFGDWVSYSAHTPAQLWAYLGSGLGFDLIHAIGCVAFALLFGPALLRSLRRFQLRTTVHWTPPSSATLGAVVVAVLAAPGVLVVAHSSRAKAATTSVSPTSGSTPLQYLRAAQNRDGGFGLASGQGSSAMASGWAVMALAAAGEDLNGFAVEGGSTAATYLRGLRIGAHSDVGTIERTLLADRAAGLRGRTTDGVPLARALRRRVSADGSVAAQANLTAFAILALRAASAPVPARMYTWLAGQRDHDGGFGFATRGGSSDVDDTGAVLEALATAPPRLATAQRNVVRGAVAYIRRMQGGDGGFPEAVGEESNAQSTAFAVQGLLAAGVDLQRVRDGNSPTPDSYLRSLIARDGAVDYARGQSQTPTWVTAEAELALVGAPLPVRPRRGHDSPALISRMAWGVGELERILIALPGG